MKTQTIVQTIGLSILMSLTSVSMAAAQNNRNKSSERNQKSPVTYKIDNNRQRTTKAPTTVYEPRQASQRTVNSRANQSSRSSANYENSHASKQQGKINKKSSNNNSYAYSGHSYKKAKQYASSGGYHSTYNYDYNHHPHHPVVINHGPHYGIKPAHRRANLVVNLPQGFFGLTLDGVRYYHRDGYFYRHHPQLGYVQVKMPKYFTHIPAGAVRVLIEGRVYYRYHNLIFKHTAFGFRLS